MPRFNAQGVAFVSARFGKFRLFGLKHFADYTRKSPKQEDAYGRAEGHDSQAIAGYLQ